MNSGGLIEAPTWAANSLMMPFLFPPVNSGGLIEASSTLATCCPSRSTRFRR